MNYGLLLFDLVVYLLENSEGHKPHTALGENKVTVVLDCR